MAARRICCRRRSTDSFSPVDCETFALQRSSEILHIIYQSNQDLEKVHFQHESQLEVLRQVSQLGYVLATYVTSGPRGQGVPLNVREAFLSWNVLKHKLGALLVSVDYKDGRVGHSNNRL